MITLHLGLGSDPPKWVGPGMGSDMRDMGLGHGYCGEIDTSIIAWYRSLGTRIPRSSWTGLDHCMHCVFHVCDCVIVCYTLRGKLIHGMMYMRNVIARENYMHDIMYIRRSGMLRLGTITLGVQKMK